MLVIRLRVAVMMTLAGALAAGQAHGAGSPAESTVRMAERLARITRETDPGLNPYRSAERAKEVETWLAEEGQGSEAPILWALAQELLNAGRTEEAIARLDHLEAIMRTLKAAPRPQDWIDLQVRQAVAQLRRAEEENCVEHHGALSCIFPIHGSGIHKEKAGARAAVAVLLRLLGDSPDNLQARWLLNIAGMTLGEYPGGVPERWLMAPKLFESEHDVKPFPDVAKGAGVDVDDLAGGSIIDDFDGDGYLDIVISSLGLEAQLRYFRNERNGRFSERTAEAGLTGLFGGLNAIQTDYNNDGHLDVLVLRGAWMGLAGRYPNSLLRNNGDGTFTDVTEEAGLLSFHPTQTAVWFDFDADGWLDLFIGNESTPDDRHPCELYRNNGDGTFSERAQESGVAAIGYVKGVASGDYDNDGLPDLYLSVRDGRNLLYHNEGPVIGMSDPTSASGAPAAPAVSGAAWRFTEVAAAAGVAEPVFSFPTWFWDYDNDGWEDLFVSGYGLNDPGDVAADHLGIPHKSERPRLYRNNRDGTFADVTKESNLHRMLLAMGGNYGDLDNDGWLDFYVGTGNPDLGMLLPNRAFRNDGGLRFQDVTTSAGLGHLQKGHGVSFGDLDNDGDQDIHESIGGAFEADHFRNALFENPGHGNHWITLKLEGTRSNHPSIGARIKVVVQTLGGERAIYKTVRSGGSFGASPLRQEIGLGDATRILRVEIRWPSGGPAQILDRMEMDRFYLVREGSARPAPIQLRSFRLGPG